MRERQDNSGWLPVETYFTKELKREKGREMLESERWLKQMEAELNLRSNTGGAISDLHVYFKSLIIYRVASLYFIGSSKLEDGSELTRPDVEDKAINNMTRKLKILGASEEEARQIAEDKINLSKRYQMEIGVKDSWT